MSGIAQDGKQPEQVTGPLKSDRIMPQSNYIRQPDDHELVLDEDHILFRGTEGKLTLRLDEKGLHAQALEGSIELEAENICLGLTPSGVGQPSKGLSFLGATDHIQMSSGLSSIYMDKKTSETIFSACRVDFYEGKMVVDEDTNDGQCSGAAVGATEGSEPKGVDSNISNRSGEANNEVILDDEKDEALGLTQSTKTPKQPADDRSMPVILQKPSNKTTSTENVAGNTDDLNALPCTSDFDASQVVSISLAEWQRLYPQLRYNQGTLLIEPDMDKMNTERGFRFAMANAFQFPKDIIQRFRGETEEFASHMKDLYWLDNKKSVAIAMNTHSKKQKNPVVRECIVRTFNDDLLPHWREEGRKIEVYWIE